MMAVGNELEALRDTQTKACPCDTVMTGIRYYDREIASIGDWMSDIEPICNGLVNDAIDPGKVSLIKNHIGKAVDVKCPDGEVVTQIHYQKRPFTFGDAVDAMTVSCAHLDCPTPIPDREVPIDIS